MSTGWPTGPLIHKLSTISELPKAHLENAGPMAPPLGVLIANLSDGAQKPGFFLELYKYISFLGML